MLLPLLSLLLLFSLPEVLVAIAVVIAAVVGNVILFPVLSSRERRREKVKARERERETFIRKIK